MPRSVLFFACAFYGAAVVWACSSSSSSPLPNPLPGETLPVPSSATGLPDTCTLSGQTISSTDAGVTVPAGLCDGGVVWFLCDVNEYRWYACSDPDVCRGCYYAPDAGPDASDASEQRRAAAPPYRRLSLW